jgi:hypothetical protein
MSLKAFHIFFIIVSIVFAAGLSAWAFKTGASDALGFVSGASSVLLLVYGMAFLKKARSIIT